MPPINSTIPTYYMGKSDKDFNTFKRSHEYIKFKQEYIAAIDFTIGFYSTYGADDNDKKNVSEGLNKFKTRLFSTNTDMNDQHLSILFQGKKAMEEIAQALIPAKGKFPFEPEEITKKLMIIYNLAGKDKDSLTGIEEIGCMVCAPGTLRNLIDTAQLLNTGSLFDNVQIQRKNIILEVIRKYVLNPQRRKERGQTISDIHDTNLLNVFINALGEEWGLSQITDIYTNPSMVTSQDKENINHQLKLAVTEDSITDKLATDYLEKIKASIITNDDGTVNLLSANTALEKYKILYGEHTINTVFSVNDRYQILGVTKDPTAIKVAMTQFIAQENSNRVPRPLDSWSEGILLNNDNPNKQLWRSGDLFWIELTDEHNDKTIALPSAQDLGMDYINKVGINQLQQIMEQSSSSEDAALFSQIRPSRLGVADNQQLTLFFAKLDTNGTIENAIVYAERYGEWFNSLVNQKNYNPLAELLLNHRKISNTSIEIWPSIALKGLSAQQAEGFLSALNTEGSGADNATAYVNSNLNWFRDLTDKNHANPLLPILLAHLTHSELVDLSPDSPFLWGLSMQQIEQFLSALDPEGNGIANAAKYAIKHIIWFDALLQNNHGNPLLPILLARLTHNELAALSPKNPSLWGLSSRQAELFLSALDPLKPEGRGVDKAIEYVTNNLEWFRKILAKNKGNPLLSILLDRLTHSELAALSLDKPYLRKLSVRQIEQFLSALDPVTSVANVIEYAAKYSTWFSHVMKTVGHNLLLPILLARLTRSELAALSPEHPALQELSVQQIGQFLSALDPETSADNAIKFVTKYSEWFEKTTKRVSHNPLLPILLSRLTHSELAALSPENPALQELSSQQIDEFLYALDPETSADNVIKYVTKYSEWFEKTTKRVSRNPLLPILLSRLTHSELAALSPENPVLQKLTVRQIGQFLSALDPETSADNAIKYVTKYSEWFENLTEILESNPLHSLLLERLSRDQLALIPDTVLYGQSEEQIDAFFSKLASDDPEMTQAIAYASQHIEWFTALIKRINKNPLLPLLIKRKGSSAPIQHLPTIVLDNLPQKQAQYFFKKLVWQLDDMKKVLKYVEDNEQWFKTLVDRNGINPLATILIEHQQKPALINLDPNIALYGLSQLQINGLLIKLDIDNDFTDTKRYVSLHKEWFATLIKKLGKNPLLPYWLKLSTEEKMTLNPDIILQDLSVKEVEEVISSLNIYQFDLRRGRFWDTTQAQSYITKYSAWFKTVSEKNGENALISPLLKSLSKEKLMKLNPDIILAGLSAEQATAFLASLSSKHGKILQYVINHQQWFTHLVERVGENPLIPILVNLKPKELIKLDPQILLKGLSAEQAVTLFSKLANGDNLIQAMNYAEKHKISFMKLVARTGENPMTLRLIKLVPNFLYTFEPDGSALWGMSAYQAEQFFAHMDSDDTLDKALKYVTDNTGWYIAFVKRTKQNPLTSLLLDRLSSEQLTKIPPEIALLGLSEKESLYYLSRMSYEQAVNYIKHNPQWFNQQEWDINAQLPTKDKNLSPLDNQGVNAWQKTEVKPQTQIDGERTRFAGQIIVQLENNLLVREAAENLAGKHPDTSLIVQLDQEGNYRVVYGDLDKLSGTLRWQLVGHSHKDEAGKQTLGGRSAETLAKQLSKFRIFSHLENNPERINLVGCSLAEGDSANSYLHQFAESLVEQDIHPASVGAYSTKVAVNDQGQKRLTETGEKVILTPHKDQWITTQNTGKIDPEGSGRELLLSLDRTDQYIAGMTQLYHDHELSIDDWLPMLGSLKKESSQHNRYSLTLVKKRSSAASPQERAVIVDDPRVSDFILEYDKHLANAKTHFSSSDEHQLLFTEESVTEAEGIHGLNTAFIIQTFFMQKARAAATDDPLPANLKIALQVHTYTSFSQMAQGTLDDGAKFIQLSKELFAEGAAASNAFKTFSTLGARAAIALNVLSIGLDSYELAHAQNEAQRAVFGTQLAFDLAFLGTYAVSLGASMVGAATVSAFAGPLMVPLAGLGIGITALVMTTQVHIEKTKLVGRYFADLDKGYQQNGYQRTTAAANSDQSIWRSCPGIAIKTLDLRRQQLTYADTYIYKTHINGIGSGYDNDITMALPQSTKYTTKEVINIREGIDHRSEVAHFAPHHDDLVVLPNTPQYYISYHYDTFPGATTRGDNGFKVLRRIESNYRSHSNNFSFDFYCCPSEYAISELEFEFVATPVTVLLDDNPRTIIMPTQSKDATNKMAYTLEGGNGTYHISLQQGAALTLMQGSRDTHWILDARALDTDTLDFTSNGLKIGSMQITLTEAQGTFSLVNHEGTFAVDRQNKKFIETEVNAHRFNDWQSLHDHLKKTCHTDSYNQPFIPVDNYITREGDRVGRAFYEVAKDRFIFTDSAREALFLEGAQLAKIDGDKAWFYRDANVWLVDITSGEILQEYITLDYEHSATPTKSELTNDDSQHLYFVTEYQKASGTTRYTWQITEQAMTLVAIEGERDDLPEINKFTWPSLSRFTYAPKVSATLGNEIHQLSRRNEHNYHTWLRKPPGEQRYLAFLDANLGHIAPEDIQPIPIEHEGKTSYYFYSRQQQTLYFQPNDGLTYELEHKAHEVKANIHALFVKQDQLIVQSEAGIIWLADAQGNLHLAGVTVDWLRANQNDVMAQLRTLVSTTATLPVLRLQGLTDHQGKIVMAWYDVAAERVIQAGAGIHLTHQLHYRGLSTDGKQAWVYDEDNQLLYRQPLVPDTPLQLNEQGRSITATPRAQRASALKYRQVLPAGSNLRLITPEGAVLLLPKNAREQDKPYLIAWQAKELTKDLLAAAIESLHNYVILAPAIRLLATQKGQTPAWYLTEQKTILSAQGLVSEHDLHWLGQAAEQAGYYIHDRTTGDLWLTGASQSTAVGRFSFITQLPEELVLQYAHTNQLKDIALPQLRGIDRLVLTGKTQGAHYLLKPTTLNHYRQIIIDEQGEQAVVQLAKTVTHLILQSSGQDLLLRDNASDTRIYIANAEQAAQRNMAIKIGDIPPISINNLVKEMYQLGAKIPNLRSLDGDSSGIELQISLTNKVLEYRSLSPDQKISSQFKTYNSEYTETNIVSLAGSMSNINTYDHGGLKTIENQVSLNEQYNSIASYKHYPLY